MTTTVISYFVRQGVELAKVSIKRYALRLSLLSAATMVLVLGFLLAVWTSGFETTIAGLALNLIASSIVAVAAITMFGLTTRLHLRDRVLSYQSSVDAGRPVYAGNRHNQARAVVAHLQDRRREPVSLLETPSSHARASFMADLRSALVEARIIYIQISFEDGDDLVRAAGTEFRSLLSRAGVTDVPLLRSLEWLAERRQLAVLVEALDGAIHASNQRDAAVRTGRRISELISAGLPVLGLIDPGSTPRDLLNNRVKLSGIDHVALAAYAPGDSDQNGTMMTRRRHAAVRRLAWALQYTALDFGSVVNVPPKMSPQSVDLEELDAATTRILENGALDSARSVAGPLMMHSGSSNTGTEAGFFQALVEEFVISDITQVDLDALRRNAVSPSSWKELPNVIHGLKVKNIIATRNDDNRFLIRIANHEIAECAAGIWLSQAGRPYLVSGDRSRIALASEVVERVMKGGDTGLAWGTALEAFREQGALSAASDSYQVLSALGCAPSGSCAAWLTELWLASDVSEQLVFARRLSANVLPSFAPFLWSRLVAPTFDHTPRLVRRYISRFLGANGALSWLALNTEWVDTVVAAEAESGLTWFADPRPTPWRGSSIASLCWILPSVVLTSAQKEPSKLLSRLTCAAVPGGGLERDKRLDPGIEISLAEGCRDAANLALIQELMLPPQVWQIIEELVYGATSWFSRQVALQAALLGASSDSQGRGAAIRTLRHILDDTSEHRLCRDYARVLSSHFATEDSDAWDQVHQYVWADDSEALEAAGGELNDDVVTILAETAILLNLSEARGRQSGTLSDTRLRRVRSLVDTKTPACISAVMPAHLVTSRSCVCALGLCGPDLSAEADLRAVSPTFAYRCLAAVTATRGARGTIDGRTRALSVHLRRLSR